MPIEVNYDAPAPGDEALRRTLIACAVAAAIACLLGVTTAFYVIDSVSGQVRTATFRATQRNCLTQAAGRDNGNRLRFALRELLRFDTDILDASARNPHQTPEQKAQLAAFLRGERDHLLHDYAVAVKKLPSLKPVSSYQDLFPLLDDIPPLHCDANLLTP